MFKCLMEGHHAKKKKKEIKQELKYKIKSEDKDGGVKKIKNKMLIHIIIYKLKITRK